MATFVDEGIVLQKTNYSETSLIVKIFTLEKGVQSFIFPGAKRKNKKGNLISSLSIIQFQYFQRNESNLAKISNVEAEVVFKAIPFDPIKSSITFFINEVILKCIKEEQHNPELYYFLKSSISILDLLENDAYFPIQFLLTFTKYLGFYPKVEKDGVFFDLLEGKISKYEPAHPNYLDKNQTKLILAILGTKFDEKIVLSLNAEKRRLLTYDILKYYQIIFDNFSTIKSLPILELTFHD